MNRIQIASLALLASAFVLAGLLVVSLSSRLPAAQAGQIITRDSFTFLTAKTRNNDESLFVIDSVNEKLLVYNTTLRSKNSRIELVGVQDLSRLFDTGTPAGGGKRPPIRP